MPPVKKSKKQAKTATPPAAAAKDASAGPEEEQLAISGQLDKKMKKIKSRIDRQRGVVCIRHLPHGFFEEQLKSYFEQFGTVTRLRLARSTRTGGSKGFAFVEFEYPQVAEVAAQTMDNYLMFQKLVKAQYIPPEQQNYNYFKSSVRKVVNKVGKPIYVSGKTASIQKRNIEHNNWTDEAYQKRIASSIRKLEKLKEKYAHLGIDFDNFTVKPNIQSVEEKETKNKKKSASVKAPEPGSTVLLKKRKQTEEKVVEVDSKKSKKTKGKKIIELKDLLDNTLQEEASSDDEEFIPTGVDEDVSTSDEEDYGLEDDVEEEKEKKPSKKVTKPNKKVDREAELLKRKTNVGGIKKSKQVLKEKTSKKPVGTAKNALKVEAAKDIKQLGQMKQMKKKDFNKSNKKKRL
ncbi:MKI67 FHA domain-interacting nucleolar phosphoprotein [Episyrphus balteatus]|uniref:MKI67 FHA domain-interacting nucleolar phosphoprotein n=1 Tax=Episyrphus balteatus TaxID=286459 RepID=UPI0024854351|nr:MKI67 FHA domain-interacting nucleolar phosphoprotein [Episyrphus balteatus]